MQDDPRRDFRGDVVAGPKAILELFAGGDSQKGKSCFGGNVADHRPRVNPYPERHGR